MGLSASPAIWQSYRRAILSSIPDISKYLAITDDLFLPIFRYGHLKYLKDLVKALFQNGLIILPKRCHIFRTKLQ